MGHGSFGGRVNVRHLLVVLSLSSAPLQAQVTQAEYAQRRAALGTKLQDGVVLAIGAQEPAHDYLSFYQTESFK
jgi:hypothetical protein